MSREGRKRRKLNSRIVSVLLAMLIALAPFASLSVFESYAAGTLPSLTEKSIYYTPNSEYNPGDCILTASKMMLRRAAIMKGSLMWTAITNTTVRPSAQTNGLLWDNFTFKADGVTYEVSSKHFESKTVSARVAEIKKLLQEHPEGIVSWGKQTLKRNAGPHGVLVVGVTSSNVVRVADSTHNRGNINNGIENWADSTMDTITKCTTYWYIKKTTGTASSSTGTVESTLRVSGVVAPQTLKKGTPFTIRGVVESNYLITGATVEVVDSTGKAVISKSAKPNSWNYDIHGLDSVVKFGTLGVGLYKYRIKATDEKKTAVLYESNLKIYDPNAPEDPTEPDTPDDPETPIDPGTTDKPNDPVVNETSDAINIEDFNYPEKLKMGGDFGISGRIKSNVKLSNVKVSITTTTGTERLSAESTPGAMTFDLDDLNNSIDFGKLAKGTYYYNVIASTDTGSKLLISKRFRVR